MIWRSRGRPRQLGQSRCLSPSSAWLWQSAVPRSQPAVEIPSAGIIVGGAVIFLYTGVAPVILEWSPRTPAPTTPAPTARPQNARHRRCGATAILATLWSQSGKTATGRIAGKLRTNLPRLFGVLRLLFLLCGLGVAGAAAVGASSEKLFRIPVWVADPKAFFATVAAVGQYLFLSANSPTLAVV